MTAIQRKCKSVKSSASPVWPHINSSINPHSWCVDYDMIQRLLPCKQQSFSTSSFPAGLGEALSCIEPEIPTKPLFHLSSHCSWHHCFPILRGFTDKKLVKNGLWRILRHTARTFHKEFSELCKHLSLKTNRNATNQTTSLYI